MDDASARARFFTRSLLRTIAAEGAKSSASARRLADPLNDGAPDMADLSIAFVSQSAGSGKVLADFARGDGGRERLTFALVFERGDWRIDDVGYAMLDGAAWTLRGLMTPAAPGPATNGEELQMAQLAFD